jgi:hypothetical protein
MIKTKKKQHYVYNKDQYDSFYRGATAQESQGLLIVEDLWSHSDAPQSVGFLWTSD